MMDINMDTKQKEASHGSPSHIEFLGAGNGDRTRDPRLGKPMLYQLSYARTILF